MKITHHFTTQDAAERLDRQIAIHRRCLLRLQAQNSKTVASSSTVLQKAG